jgi:hypothetical protein
MCISGGNLERKYPEFVLYRFPPGVKVVNREIHDSPIRSEPMAMYRQSLDLCESVSVEAPHVIAKFATRVAL